MGFYKTNATSHPNIGSLKIAIEEELNKIAEWFIFKGMKIVLNVFWYNNRKNDGHIVLEVPVV